MGRYSLVAIDRKNNNEKTIKFYNEETGKDISNFRLQDIDVFTSAFAGELNLTSYLIQNGMSDYDNARYSILTTYKGNDYYFKVIFDSALIRRVAIKVHAGQVEIDDDFHDVIHSFYARINEESFLESIENTKYFKERLKSKLIRYIELTNQEKDREYEIIEQQQLKFEINEEFKRYKTFRGLYLFLEKYKKYGYVDKPNPQYHCRPKVEENVAKNVNVAQYNSIANDEEQQTFISNVDDYNRAYDEFLSEEEYAEAYGEDNATQYVKGARRND